MNPLLSRNNLAVGTRALSAQSTTFYQLPAEAVSEAIVTTSAHRDRTTNDTVQMMLLADRQEAWSHGDWGPALNLQSLRQSQGRCVTSGSAEPSFALTDRFMATSWSKPELALEHVGGKSAPVSQQVTPQVTQQVTPQVAQPLAA